MISLLTINVCGVSNKHCLLPFFIFDWIFFFRAGNNNMRQSLDEFEFQPDPTTDYRVTCPRESEKLMYNVVKTLAPSFLIGSSSILQVIRTTTKSRMSSKFGQIQP